MFPPISNRLTILVVTDTERTMPKFVCEDKDALKLQKSQFLEFKKIINSARATIPFWFSLILRVFEGIYAPN